MKKSVLTFALTASVLALSACSGQSNSDVLVQSKAGDITKEELYQEMKSSVGDSAVQMLILEKVLSSNYDVSEKDVDAEFNTSKEQLGESFSAYLAQNGHTEESYKKSIRLNLLQEAALIEGIEITDEEIKTYIERSKKELNARHVLVEDEATALEVKTKLEAGEDFATVAKEFSIEPAAQQSGGELGWFGPSGMVKEFTDASYALDVNKFSEPVKTKHGYHIIQVTETRDVESDLDFEKDKEDIRKQLAYAQADQDAFLDKVTTMLKDADIKINDEDLKDALDQLLNA